MPKVFLINPPSTSPRQREEHSGLGYLTAMLRHQGYDVSPLNAYAMTVNEVCHRVGSAPQPAGIVGISPYIDSYEAAVELTRRLSKRGWIVVWGGHLATFSAREIVSRLPSLSGVCCGESEFAFSQWVEHVAKSGGPPSAKHVPNCAQYIDGEFVAPNYAPLVEDLDSLPFPAREEAPYLLENGKAAHVVSSRGCYGGCTFCSIVEFYRQSKGPRWRSRSASNVVEELSHLYSAGHRDVKFVDDCFFGPGKAGQSRALELAADMRQRGLVMNMHIACRANDVRAETIANLAKVGLSIVSVGIESSSDEELRRYKKGTTRATNDTAIEILRTADVEFLMEYITFGPYTTWEILKQNLEYYCAHSWAIQRPITDKLHVHAADPITFSLRDEGRLTSRSFPNYEYDFADVEVAQLYDAASDLFAPYALQYFSIFQRLTGGSLRSDEAYEDTKEKHIAMKAVYADVVQQLVRSIECHRRVTDTVAAAAASRLAAEMPKLGLNNVS